MYISSDRDQLTIEDFFMPFGGKLLKMRTPPAKIISTGEIEQRFR